MKLRTKEVDNYNLKSGNSRYVDFTVSPDNAASKKVTITSSNENVVKITNSGSSYFYMNAVGNGSATITIASTDGSNIKKTLNVNVYTPISGITVNPTFYNINVGESAKISYSVTPSNSTEKIVYKSSNTNVATVDSTGKITGISGGETVIYIGGEDTGFLKTVSVKVSIPLKDIKLSKQSVLLKKGEEETLSITSDPVNTTESYTVSYKSDNASVATVSSSGLITAKSNGTATITVTTSNGLTKKCKVTVGEYQRGDFSKNGEVKLDDAIIGLRKVFGYISSDNNDLSIGDLNNNGKLDLADIIILLRYVFGYINNI